MKTITALFFLLIGTLVTGQNKLNCKVYHTGFFEFEGKHSNVVIYRNKKYQIEYNTANNEWITIKLNWTSNCNYSFTFINTNMDNIKPFIGHSIDVNITSGNSEGYVYHSVVKDEGKEFDGKIIFLVTDTDNSIKRKIKHKLKETKS